MKMDDAQDKPRPYRQRARAEAAEATGQRIVDAFLARLMEGWFDEITLDAVAKDAGVTVQTVVRRFGGKDGLLADSIQTLADRINTQRATPYGDIDRMLDNLLTDYEVTGDAVIRLLALEDRQKAVRDFTNLGRREHRGWLESVLEEQLAGLATETRKRALDAIVIATDVYTWKLLRRDMKRGVAQTKSTMKQLINAAISDASGAKSKGD